MNGMYIIGLIFIVGIIIGIFLSRFFKKDDLNTDECLNFLKEKGYWVRLNIGPKSDKD